jgi:hypothetical protein
VNFYQTTTQHYNPDDSILTTVGHDLGILNTVQFTCTHDVTLALPR